jgi:hypothetical protein
MTGEFSVATLKGHSRQAMKRFQNILVVVQPGFDALLAIWTTLIARNAGTREMCLMRLHERPDPLLTRA